MHPGQRDDGLAGVDVDDRGGGEVLAEVRSSAHEILRERPRVRHVTDVGEALFMQEIVEDVERREAGRRVLSEP
jgi:hypothetical protein